MVANGNGNGNGALKRVHVYAALVMIALPCGKILFTAGGTDARTQEQITNLKQQQIQDEQTYARKDVLEERLTGIERSLAKTETKLDNSNQVLEDIKVDLKRHGGKS